MYYGVKKGQGNQEQGFINLWLYRVPEYSRSRTTVSVFLSRAPSDFSSLLQAVINCAFHLG